MGLWTLLIFWNSEISKEKKNTTFRKLNLFLSIVEGKETPTLLSPLEKSSSD
jgi:hypothetical protein